MVSLLNQPSADALSPAEVASWIDNAIDGLQCGADYAQVAAMLFHIRKRLAPLVELPAQCERWQATRTLKVGRRTDRGMRRQNRPNEDVSWASQGILPDTGQPFGLFLVADGMGGHANGQIASRLAMEALVEYIHPRLLFEHQRPSEVLLADAVLAANDAVLAAKEIYPGLRTMGTTVTVALVVDGSVSYIANVGDSRTYLYRTGEGLTQLTVDHSTIAQLLTAKAITPDEVASHPKRTEIYRSLGDKKELAVDTCTIDLRLGDLLLLCSDGICGYDLSAPVNDARIEAILQTDAVPGEKAYRLIEAAKEAGGPDNCSAIVVHVDSDVDAQDTLVPVEGIPLSLG